MMLPAYVNNFQHTQVEFSIKMILNCTTTTTLFCFFIVFNDNDEMRSRGRKSWSGWLYLNRILRGISRWSTTIYTLWLLVSCYHFFFFSSCSHSIERVAQFMHVHSSLVVSSISLLFVSLITSKRFIASCWWRDIPLSGLKERVGLFR